MLPTVITHPSVCTSRHNVTYSYYPPFYMHLSTRFVLSLHFTHVFVHPSSQLRADMAAAHPELFRHVGTLHLQQLYNIMYRHKQNCPTAGHEDV
jgi:hypothetical protein